MKKQLLFTIAFLGALTFSFAQLSSEASFDAAGADLQIFTVGQQDADDINDPAIVTALGGGTVATNNNFLGILGDSNTNDGVTGTIIFTVTTNSATAILTPLNLTLEKRGGCSVNGTVSVTGYSDTTFAYASDGTTGGASPEINFQFGEIISLVSGSPLTVTITLEEMLNVDNTTNPIFRIQDVILEKDGTLGIDDLSNNDIETRIFPNPVVNNFKIESNTTIESVTLYNITGRLIKTFNEQANYDISDLVAGIYLANIETELGSQTMKIVKE
ncbi:T9SS type A sorting domain-containing protein [uncultured Winogradskyella sp.]|uniref:T9SS type A sorting domain-containing protein n=1 Tax=Winogradskyella sp. 4-2091 TaxID=3381659 RepID=UPI00262CB311|nr:T9SS type A sorting domain-containing protein [uncultured Winogradskyella sp.]